MTMICKNCGRPLLATNSIVCPKEDGAYLLCKDCYKLLGHCPTCEHSDYCGFAEDPDPMPQVIVIQKRQETPTGYSIIQQQVPNTERLWKFCLEGKCICCNEDDKKDPYCHRYIDAMTCANYKEKEF